MESDELATAQNLSSVKGKLLRLDVTNGNLAFPAANPHQTIGDGIPDEIIAEGLRNVWRFPFDRLTGDMWLGDVGYDSYEEIDFLPYGTFENRNLGWSCLEGNFPINSGFCSPSTVLTAPIHTYAGYDFNGQKNACVIGGYVYRGNEYAGLNGWYFFADYNSDEVWRMKMGNQTIVEKVTDGFTKPVSFGENLAGDLFLISYTEGIVYKMQVDCAAQVNLSGLHTANDIVQTAVNLNSSKTVTNTLNVEYWSASNITLSPGFKSEPGTVFKAEIGNCDN